MNDRIRNIGIIAHVDAGKTTTAERVLFHTGKSHRMGDTHDGNTVMDFDPQERDRAITINSAATTVFWRDHAINLIDTPGHIDFNIEVRRSLRVLDGAVVVLDGVAGVEPQTETNWRLADQYHVPRLVLVNKLDRTGADFLRVVGLLRSRLGVEPLVTQLPIGSEGEFRGVIDLLRSRAMLWSADKGEPYTVSEIPSEMAEQAMLWRSRLVEQVVDQDDAVLQRWLENRMPTEEELVACIRKGTLAGAFVPVLAGSAYRSIGIERVLDAVVDYLPAPMDVDNGIDAAVDAPFAALVFKVTSDGHGQLSYLRVYRGCVRAGDTVLNAVTGKRERISRLYEMHADKKNEIAQAESGRIVAVLGPKEAMTGHTLTDPAHPLVLEQIVASEPVIDIAIEPKRQSDQQNLGQALHILSREDPSLRVRQDAESGQIILSGMGELQLDVRMKDLQTRFNVEVRAGRPQVAYRETITQTVEERHLHKKQNSGPGQYAEVALRLRPLAAGEGIRFVDRIVGGAVPNEYIPAVEKGIRNAATRGVLAGYPSVDIEVTLFDGGYHEQDSSGLAFELAAMAAFQSAMRKAAPVLLEPVMAVEVQLPLDYVGDCIGDLNRRRGLVRSQDMRDDISVIQASVPLQEMFGYIGSLRALSSGRGGFTMQFEAYAPVPASMTAKIVNRE